MFMYSVLGWLNIRGYIYNTWGSCMKYKQQGYNFQMAKKLIYKIGKFKVFWFTHVHDGKIDHYIRGQLAIN